MSAEVVIIPRGGGDEVGASFYEMLVDDEHYAFDCGIRPSRFKTDILPIHTKDKQLRDFLSEMSIKPERSPLPNLVDVPEIKALFLTHGHLDHVGAVPILARKDRYMVIYATPATRRLCELHCFETIRIAERNEEVPLFSKSDVEFTLSRVVEILPGQLVKVNDKLSVRPIEAGHILGAVSYIIYIDGQPVGFHTGDFSCSHQRTVPGAPEARFDRLQFLTIDSTRLTEKNLPRETVEEECMDQMRQAHIQGIKIRFLVFSIGRAQEAFALAKEACPEAQIWIDGQAKEVSILYAKHLNGVFSGIEKHFVLDETQRQRIINSEAPNIVIVPSAMQFGGHSRKYTVYGCERKDHLFVSLGWIDPCSPEYAFFESSRGDVFRFGDKDKPVFSQTARHNLTAHCDGEDVLAVQDRLNAEKVILVHGDGEKMDQFIENHPRRGFIRGNNNKPILV